MPATSLSLTKGVMLYKGKNTETLERIPAKAGPKMNAADSKASKRE